MAGRFPAADVACNSDQITVSMLVREEELRSRMEGVTIEQLEDSVEFGDDADMEMEDCKDEFAVGGELTEVFVPEEETNLTRVSAGRYCVKKVDEVKSRLKVVKRIEKAVTKPSFVLGRGNEKVRASNRVKLYKLLRRLVRSQNWKEVSGVLSLVLKATGKDFSPANNRLKYWAAMELVKQSKNFRMDKKIGCIFKVWMDKFKDRGVAGTKVLTGIKQDFILFCLSLVENKMATGDSSTLKTLLETTAREAKTLLQMRNSGTDPIRDLIMGLTYYQVWYVSLPDKMRLAHEDDPDTRMESDCSGSIRNALVEYSNRPLSVFSYGSEGQNHYESETSVRNDKKISHGLSGSKGKIVSHQGDDNLDRENVDQFQSQGFYMTPFENSEEEAPSQDFHVNQHLSIFATHGTEPWLLPIHLSNVKESLDDYRHLRKRTELTEYKLAVEYLSHAVHASPPVTAALVPLVQLLLIGDLATKAMEELERFSSSTGMALPIRIKACLLEHLEGCNYSTQIFCYESILKKDPVCKHSLAALIRLHREGIRADRGEYNPDSLIEMIASHLDATCADHNTWEAFALCLFELSRVEEDRLSVRQKRNEHGQRHAITSQIPRLFMEARLAKSWTFRLKYWLKRHFANSIWEQEVATSDIHLIAYKAACASHMYGRDFEYVERAHSCLEKEEDSSDLLLFLQRHMQHSVGFYFNTLQKL